MNFDIKCAGNECQQSATFYEVHTKRAFCKDCVQHANEVGHGGGEPREYLHMRQDELKLARTLHMQAEMAKTDPEAADFHARLALRKYFIAKGEADIVNALASIYGSLGH